MTCRNVNLINLRDDDICLEKHVLPINLRDINWQRSLTWEEVQGQFIIIEKVDLLEYLVLIERVNRDKVKTSADNDGSSQILSAAFQADDRVRSHIFDWRKE